MTNYVNKAQGHAEKIDYYYAHASADGYAQSHHHQLELDKLLRSAYDSQKNKNDVIVIQAIIKRISPIMNEMKKREEEFKSE